jgi:hypothetical protein|tara:strand:- start:1598 stop:1834 length:237 start_codon:yes stop_codon:yes gene_type:complete
MNRQLENHIIDCLFELSRPLTGVPVTISLDADSHEVVLQTVGVVVAVHTINANQFLAMSPHAVLQLARSFAEDAGVAA